MISDKLKDKKTQKKIKLVIIIIYAILFVTIFIIGDGEIANNKTSYFLIAILAIISVIIGRLGTKK